MIAPLKIFALVMLTLLVTACGNETQPTRVKAIKVSSSDAPLSLVFDGQIVFGDTVKVQSKISGNVDEIFVEADQSVVEGQPLFKIDSRQTESAALQARANLAKSMTALAKARVELQRDEELSAQRAVSESALAERRFEVSELDAEVADNQALVKQTQDDLTDTTIYAPTSGRLSDVAALGTFCEAGDTTLATIGTVNPACVQFKVSEAEFARLSRAGDVKISLTLADGSAYPYSGTFAEFNGTSTVRTIFPNPDGVLVPDMKARVSIDGLKVANSLLVPESAIRQVSGETSVIVVTADNKASVRKISLGEKLGSNYVVTGDISADDSVVVEAPENLRDGMSLDVTRN